LTALAQGWELEKPTAWDDDELVWVDNGDLIIYQKDYTPSSGNAQTYELIEKFNLEVNGLYKEACYCKNKDPDCKVYWKCIEAKTPALAICKAVIASKWGNTIPDNVMEKVK